MRIHLRKLVTVSLVLVAGFVIGLNVFYFTHSSRTIVISDIKRIKTRTHGADPPGVQAPGEQAPGEQAPGARTPAAPPARPEQSEAEVPQHGMLLSLWRYLVADPLPSHGGGGGRPGSTVWRNKHDQYDDRIVAQLQFSEAVARRRPPGLKRILMYHGLGETPAGRQKFRADQCAVDACELTDDYKHTAEADAIVFQNEYDYVRHKPAHQVWVLWNLESPANTADYTQFADRINWTASFRSDSTIVTPYEKFVHFANYSGLPARPARNYAQGKTKKVAWFVSNCSPRNKRMELAQELKKYIEVDIFGACGSSFLGKEEGSKVLNKDYKFYLSFENSNCKHYITEKLYWNGLFNDVVPIVMGARPEDYRAVAPPGSFIHVEDFPDVRALAAHLHALDRDDAAYNQYFRWKGTGRFINTKFWCRLCAMVHEQGDALRWYRSVEKWWRPPGGCTYDRWDRQQDLVTDWKTYIDGTSPMDEPGGALTGASSGVKVMRRTTLLRT